MFFSSTAAAAQQQQHSSSSTAAVVAATLSCCFGPSTPGQTRTPNEENGTPKRDLFSGLAAYYCRMHCGSALRIVLRDASRIVEQQKQQYSSSSTAAAAQQQWWQRRRGYGRKGRAWIHR